MTNDRFKELLNLHLDHRLTVAEASELELALRDPERRRVFRSYAAMQRGCAELFRRSAEDSPAPDALLVALRQAEGRMRNSPDRRQSGWAWQTWGAGAGVAALLAVVVVRVNQPVMVAVEPASPSPKPVVVAVAPAPAIAPAPALVRVRMPDHLTLAALGIAPDSHPHPSLSRWAESEPASAAYNLASTSETVWVPEVSAAELESWNRPRASATSFSGRPINAWASQSGIQVQNASYTFER